MCFFFQHEPHEEKNLFCTEYLYDDFIAEKCAQNVVLLPGMPQNTLTNPQAGCVQPMHPVRNVNLLVQPNEKVKLLLKGS